MSENVFTMVHVLRPVKFNYSELPYTAASGLLNAMSLLFQPEHIDKIRNGTKTATRRDWSDNYNPPTLESIQIAATHLFTSEENADCYVKINQVYDQQLGEMTPEDALKEGGYSAEEFKQVWKDINGSWDPTKLVTVVEFEYIGKTRPDSNTTSESHEPIK